MPRFRDCLSSAIRSVGSDLLILAMAVSFFPQQAQVIATWLLSLPAWTFVLAALCLFFVGAIVAPNRNYGKGD